MNPGYSLAFVFAYNQLELRLYGREFGSSPYKRRGDHVSPITIASGWGRPKWLLQIKTALEGAKVGARGAASLAQFLQKAIRRPGYRPSADKITSLVREWEESRVLRQSKNEGEK